MEIRPESRRRTEFRGRESVNGKQTRKRKQEQSASATSGEQTTVLISVTVAEHRLARQQVKSLSSKRPRPN